MIHRTIVNELGNFIHFDVVARHNGITVKAAGPTSFVDHTWTRKEAVTLRDLLNKVLEAP